MKDILNWNQISNDFQILLLDTAHKVEGFLCNPETENRFKAAIDRFMSLLLAHYSESSSCKNPDPLEWFLSPQTSLCDALLAAKRIDGNSIELQQREPTPTEISMLYYVKLMVIHDLLAKTLNISEQYFKIDDISNQTDVGIVAQDIWDKVTDSKSCDIEKNRINIALNAIQTDLASTNPAETKQNAKRIIAALLISFIMILSFELFIYLRPVTWIVNHPRSYGIQGSVICLIPCLIFGFFKPGWRKRCLESAIIPFIVGLLSLL